jgi:hypothetical protein
VLITGEAPETKDWYQTVPDPGVLVTSLNPQTRRTFSPLCDMLDIAM